MFKIAILIIGTCLMITTFSSAWGYQYHYYNPKKINVSQRMFERYIRPQLRSIVYEYYHIVTKISPSTNGVIKINKGALELQNAWSRWENKCSKFNKETCSSMLESIYNLSRKLDKKILYAQKKWPLVVKQSNNTKNLLKLTQFLDRISTYNYQLMHKIEAIIIGRNTPYDRKLSIDEKFSPLIHNILLDASFAITSILNEKLRTDFENIYHHYIQHFEQHILAPNDQQFLINNLERFNVTWNSFHMRLTKGHVSVPGNITKTIKIMHNRWNSILKVYLKNVSFIDINKKVKQTNKRRAGQKRKASNRRP